MLQPRFRGQHKKLIAKEVLRQNCFISKTKEAAEWMEVGGIRAEVLNATAPIRGKEQKPSTNQKGEIAHLN